MSEKNLLIISNNFPNEKNTYVGDIFVKEQIKFLKEYFDNVFVISPIPYGMEYLRKTTYRDYQYDNVKVFFPKYLNFPFFYNHLRWGWIFLEMNAIKSLIKKQRISFNFIHAHFTWPSGTVALELKKSFPVPVVVTEHTHISLYKEFERKNSYYINTLKNCDAVIRVNEKDIPLLVKIGIEEKKIYHIVNGYDPKKFYPISTKKAREILNLPNDKKIILTISRLDEEKGQKFLISAISEILKNRMDFICFIGGTGSERDNLIKKINDSNLQNFVSLIGFVPDNDMVFWINACDVFVLPSISEGNPTVMFETLGCGKPFVGTKVGGIPEVILSEDHGLLTQPGDAKELAEKLELALEKAWDQQKILTYADQFTWGNIAKEIVKVYSKIS